MRKSDLKPGMVIEKRDGSRNLVTRVCDGEGERKWPNLDGHMYINPNSYNDDLTTRGGFASFDYTFDVVKVYKDYTCQEVLWERWEREERPELTMYEKNVLKYLPLEYRNWWMARDGINDKLYLYETKPKPYSMSWNNGCLGEMWDMKSHKDHFKFITWEGEECYKVGYLLGECDSNE